MSFSSLRSSAGKYLFLAFLFVFLIPASGWSKSKVAVLPWKVNSAENLDFVRSAMLDMLATRIGSADVEVTTPDAVKEALAHVKSAEVTEAVAKEAGKKLKADYVLYGSLTVLGSSVSLDARLLNMKDNSSTPFFSKGTGMDSVIGLTDKLSTDVAVAVGGAPLPVAKAPATPAEPRPQAKTAPSAPQQEAKDSFIIKTKEEYDKAVSWRSGLFDGMYISATAADVNRDGAKEVFVLSKRDLKIGVIRDEGLEVVKEFKSTDTDWIAIAAMDSDGDGAPEVYISGVKNGAPATSLLEYSSGTYSITKTNIPWLVRAYNYNGRQYLIGQGFRRADGFYGPLKILRKEGGGVADKGAFEIALPRKIDIYRFDVIDAGKGEKALAAIDDSGRLVVYRKDDKGRWDRSWKSDDHFGGTLNHIEFFDYRSGVSQQPPVPVDGGIIRMEAVRDGKPELIVKRGVPGGLGRWADKPGSYKSGNVISLSWDGSELKENWRTKDIKGYLADFVIDSVTKDGGPEILMVVVEGTEGLKNAEKSYLLLHKLSVQ